MLGLVGAASVVVFVSFIACGILMRYPEFGLKGFYG